MEEIRKIKKGDYPSQLLEIPQVPEELFVRGTLPQDDALLLCVVGSRKYTEYGKEVCEKILSELRGFPIVIVSGLALGIDAIAHRAALKAGLQTVAFPGSGLSQKVLYPASNFGLAETILKAGGALISEFEPDFKATPYAFPQRNRLMAGFCHATLVIEAGEKSGTLITARLATEYNKDVFAVPASIFSQNAIGSNWLLKQGATPVTSGKDILEHWNLVSESESKQQELHIPEDCTEEEHMVMALLREPLSKTELIQKLDMPISEINILLSSMEIKGLIKETLGELRINF